MPPTGKTNKGWHLPGYNWCGPFTDIEKAGSPVNSVDECCRQHDHHYNSPGVSTRDADNEFIDCVGKNHPLGLIFRGKRTIDDLTSHASDKIFRPGIRKLTHAEISQYRARDKRIKLAKEAASQKSARTSGLGEKRTATQAGNIEQTNEEGQVIMEDNMETCENDGEPRSKRSKRDMGASSSNMGGGGGISGGPSCAGELDRPFGQTSARYTKRFKKTFVSYVTNGITDNANYGWKQNTATTDPDTYTTSIEWCEGWAIVPWGVLAASISRHEYNLLQLQSRRWRVKKFGVEIEGVIPFQNALFGGSTTKESTTTFSNRPNLHIYVDDGHLLPQQYQWGSTSISHNNTFQTPYTKFSNSKLATPKWILYNVDTSKWQQKNAALPPATEPQQLLSLYNTGMVNSLYPGQKFSREYHVMNSGWHGGRGMFDRYAHIKADKIPSNVGPILSSWSLGPCEPIGGCFKRRDKPATGTTSDEQFLQTWTEDIQGAEEFNDEVAYEDTGLPCARRSPPYILIRMEPYCQPNDSWMEIYAQLHIHYWMDVEIEEMDFYSQAYDPTNYQAMIVQASNFQTADSDIKQACSVGPCDNSINRLGNFHHNTYNWG